jgi:hypothetical protein
VYHNGTTLSTDRSSIGLAATLSPTDESAAEPFLSVAGNPASIAALLERSGAALVRLENQAGDPLWVNPNSVLLIGTGYGGVTEIHLRSTSHRERNSLAHADSVRSRLAPSQVARLINAALDGPDKGSPDVGFEV